MGKLLTMAQWTFIAQNVVILSSLRSSERSATLGTTQRVQSYQHWEFHKDYLTNIGNCAKSVLTDVRTSASTLAALLREWGSSTEPWKKPTGKNAAYTYGTMTFYSRIDNLFPNS
jgi:hypothetical protein